MQYLVSTATVARKNFVTFKFRIFCNLQKFICKILFCKSLNANRNYQYAASNMALLRYFAKSKSLPDPNGPLSSKLKPETIDSANRKVSALLASTGTSSAKDDGSGQRSRGSYMKFTPEQKAQVARYALESGNKRAIVKYSKQWGVDLKESTVRTWKAKYTKGLWKRKTTEPLPIKALPDQKQGRPLLLADELDTGVQAYVESIRKLGGVVNTAIVLGGAEAIIADRKRCSRATNHSKNTSVCRVTGCVKT